MDESPKRTYNILRFTHVGLSFLLLILLPTFGGYWLDQRTGTRGLWTLAGAAFGFSLGIYFLIVETRKIDQG